MLPSLCSTPLSTGSTERPMETLRFETFGASGTWPTGAFKAIAWLQQAQQQVLNHHPVT